MTRSHAAFLVRLALAWVCLAAPTATAQRTATLDLHPWWGVCNEAMANGDWTTDSLLACESDQYADADAELNTAYSDAMYTLRVNEQTETRDGLRRAQRAWIAFRDADCDGATPMPLREERDDERYSQYDDDLHAAQVIACKAAATRLRTEQLRTYPEAYLPD